MYASDAAYIFTSILEFIEKQVSTNTDIKRIENASEIKKKILISLMIFKSAAEFINLIYAIERLNREKAFALARSMSQVARPYELDEKDKEILRILTRDSRASYVEIARELNMSEGAVRKRIDNLLKTGIIKKFTIETNVPSLSALILISTIPEVPNPEISQQVASIDGVSWVYETAGQYDIATLVSGTDIAFINGCIDKIRSIKGVSHTNTLIVLRSW